MSLLDKKQAAEYLTVSTDVLMDELHAGRVVGFRIGRQWRFDTRDLEQYINRLRQDAAASAAEKTKRHGRTGQVVSISPKSLNGTRKTVGPWVPGMSITDVCGQKN